MRTVKVLFKAQCYTNNYAHQGIHQWNLCGCLLYYVRPKKLKEFMTQSSSGGEGHLSPPLVRSAGMS